MATIHSLPQELIRHILALAYPPGASGWLANNRGLCSTALVHSTGRAPSVSVMTQWMDLPGSSAGDQALQRFLETGPSGIRCSELTLSKVDGPAVLAVLSKMAHVGRLWLWSMPDFDLGQVFGLASCKDLTCFTLGPKGPASNQSQTWPVRLRELRLYCRTCPVDLLLASCATLTTLILSFPDETLLVSLATAGPRLVALHKLHLQTGPTERPSPTFWAAATRAVNSLTTLAELGCSNVPPDLLRELLASRRARTGLRALETKFLTEQFGVSALPKIKDWDQMLSKLRRIGRLEGVKAIARWTIKYVKSGRDRKGTQTEEWVRKRVKGWAEWENEMKATGVKMTLEIS